MISKKELVKKVKELEERIKSHRKDLITIRDYLGLNCIFREKDPIPPFMWIGRFQTANKNQQPVKTKDFNLLLQHLGLTIENIEAKPKTKVIKKIKEKK